MAAADPSTALMRLINSYQVSQALHVAAMLGVADRLKDGPQACDSLAQACGAHPRSLYRLLRALAAVGVFQELDGKTFGLTPMGFCLTEDAPASRRHYARWIGTPGLWRSWGNLLHSITTGENATLLTWGADSWTYRDEHPEEQAVFNSAMTGNSASEAQAVIAAYDFSKFACIVDIGGGQGLLLQELLLACPDARGDGWAGKAHDASLMHPTYSYVGKFILTVHVRFGILHGSAGEERLPLRKGSKDVFRPVPLHPAGPREGGRAACGAGGSGAGAGGAGCAFARDARAGA
jgi:hypothetical protein